MFRINGKEYERVDASEFPVKVIEESLREGVAYFKGQPVWAREIEDRVVEPITPLTPPTLVPNTEFFNKAKKQVFWELRNTGGVSPETVEKYGWVFRKEAQVSLPRYIKQVIKNAMAGRTFGGTIVDKSFCKSLNARGTIGSSGRDKNGSQVWRQKHGFTVGVAQEVCYKVYGQSCWHRAREIVKEAFANPVYRVKESVEVPIVKVFNLTGKDKPIRIAGRGFYTPQKLCGVMGVDLDYCLSILHHGFKDILLGEELYEIQYDYVGKPYCFVLHDDTRFTSHLQAMQHGYLPEHLYVAKIRVWKH